MVSGCSSAAAADIRAGDCLRVAGPPDRPDTSRVNCDSPESNYHVVEMVANSEECPTDVDSYYSTRGSFNGSPTTVCMDIAWVVGSCLSIDPENDRDPLRVDCADTSAPNRQRATQILKGVASVDQCGSGVGYAYDERQFTVCVEDVS